MKYTFKIVLALFFISLFIFHFSPPVHAQFASYFQPPAVRASRKPSITLQFASQRFIISAKNVQKVTYTLEYTRTSRSGDILEGFQGVGKAKGGNYIGVHYAGTQSSKYFIPHSVKSGKLALRGTDLNGRAFSYTAEFVMKKNKLVITKVY